LWAEDLSGHVGSTYNIHPAWKKLSIKCPLIYQNQKTHSESETQFIIWVGEINVGLDNSDATETVHGRIKSAVKSAVLKVLVLTLVRQQILRKPFNIHRDSMVGEAKNVPQ